MSQNGSLRAAEDEVERVRADLMGTLDQLRDKLDPAAHVRIAAEEFGRGMISLYGHEPGTPAARREVGRLLADNVLPLALIASGLAWLVVGEIRRFQARSYLDERNFLPNERAPATVIAKSPTTPGVHQGSPSGGADSPLSGGSGRLR